MKSFATRILGVALLAAIACAPATAPAPGTTSTTAPAAPTAQSGSASTPAPSEKRAAVQNLRVAQIGLPASLNPQASAYNFPVFGAMYDPILFIDAKANVKPWVATSWKSVDDTTWRLTIRKDLTFSNGDKLTADDVAFTLNTFVEKKWPQMSQLINLTGAKKVDDYTVDVTTKVKDASVLAGLTYAWVLPQKYYESVGNDGFSAKPIGSGPYVLEEFRAGDIATFKKRPTEHPFRKVIATEYTVRSITEQTQMAAGLQTGDLDIVYGSLSPDIVQQISKTDAKIQSQENSIINGLLSQPEAQERDTPLQNIKVREALNYAVDKEAIAKTLFLGYAEPTGQLSAPNSPSWDPNLKPYPHDPAKAKQLLAEAGYPNGFKLEVGIQFTPQTVNPNIAAAIQANLRDVGIDAPIQSMELAAFLDPYYGRNNAKKGDIFLQSTGDPNGFMTQVQGLYSCSRSVHWWCNPKFDELMQEATGEPDVAKRGALMRQAIRILHDDVAHLHLIISSTFVIQSPKVRGFNWDDYGYAFYFFDNAYKVE